MSKSKRHGPLPGCPSRQDMISASVFMEHRGFTYGEWSIMVSLCDSDVEIRRYILAFAKECLDAWNGLAPSRGRFSYEIAAIAASNAYANARKEMRNYPEEYISKLMEPPAPWSKEQTEEERKAYYIRIEGGIPRIVSDELFFKVQEVLKTKKNPQGRHRTNGDYLLTGKLFCGKCKSPMVGISGTSRTGDLHYYYTCQKKRVDKACDKANVRRDAIEEAVARAIQEYALQDDVIGWIADSTVAYNRRQEEQSHVSILEDELADTKRSIKNIIAAIEQGIITDSTKGRLLELEAEQARLTGKIAASRADIITISRDDIISGLQMFRDGDVTDKKHQARLFDTFLVAVYVYDDDLKIVFSF